MSSQTLNVQYKQTKWQFVLGVLLIPVDFICSGGNAFLNLFNVPVSRIVERRHKHEDKTHWARLAEINREIEELYYVEVGKRPGEDLNEWYWPKFWSLWKEREKLTEQLHLFPEDAVSVH